MIQLPVLPSDNPSFRIPFPTQFEHWQHVGEKLFVFAGVALVLHLIVRLAHRQADALVEDPVRRHTIRKWIGYGYIAALVLVGFGLFSSALARLGTILALLLAGLAVALQDVLKSVVAWLYISSRSGLRIGDRVEVNGVTGDVIDIGVLKTSLLEVGNLVFGLQSTGRVVTVPNYSMLSFNVFSDTITNPYVWQEIRVVVTYESDWQRADALLREIAGAHHAEIAAELERGFRTMEQRYAFRAGTLTPIVYVSIAAHGIDLTMRFLTHSRSRRASIDSVTRQVLQALEQDPRIELAYPTYRIFRLGEEVPGRIGAAATHPESQKPEPKPGSHGDS
jgi:small-conductance mechanosensitive channel